jgi:hypothetical protein
MEATVVEPDFARKDNRVGQNGRVFVRREGVLPNCEDEGRKKQLLISEEKKEEEETGEFGSKG